MQTGMASAGDSRNVLALIEEQTAEITRFELLMEAHKSQSPSYPGRKQRRLRQILLEALSSPVLRWFGEEGCCGWMWSRNRFVNYYLNHMFDVLRPNVDEFEYFLGKMKGRKTGIMAVQFLTIQAQHMTLVRGLPPYGDQVYEYRIGALAGAVITELGEYETIEALIGRIDRQKEIYRTQPLYQILSDFAGKLKEWIEPSA